MQSSIERFPAPLPVPFSKAVRAGNFLFLSGVLALDAQANVIDGDITVQTRVLLERIAAASRYVLMGSRGFSRALLQSSFGTPNEEIVAATKSLGRSTHRVHDS